MERLTVQPHETRVVTNQINQDVAIEIDIFSERVERVDVPVYVDEEVERVVDRAVTREVDIPIEIDIYTERHVEEIRERIVEVPVERIVETEHIIDEYVDEPYDVVVPVRKEVIVPVDRIVHKEVERICPVNIEIDTFQEVEVQKERIVENIIDIERKRPEFHNVEVELPEVETRPIEHQVTIYKEIPTEKIEFQEAPYPQERVIETAVQLDLHLNVEKVVEVPEIEERIEQKEYKVEKIVEQYQDVYVDKKIFLKKIVEIPRINRIVKRVPREKIVEVYHEKVVDNIIEVEETVEEDVDVHLKEVQGVLQVNEKITHMPLNTITRREHISKRQIQEFESSSRQLAELQSENEAFSHQINYLEEHISAINPRRLEEAKCE